MIVCLGTTPVYQRSMVFERLRVDEVNRAAAVHDYASGKSINVARVLRTMGEDVVATGFVGSGERGDALLADLDRAGIAHDFVRVGPAARQCVTVIDRAAGTATELVEESRPVADGDWAELMRRVSGLATRARGWVMSGSLPPGADDGFYRDCLAVAGGGVPVILDTRRAPLREALSARGFVAKLNRDELAETVGRPVDSDEALRRAARDVAPEAGGVVVTAGAGGVVAFDGNQFWRVRPPRVEAKSAVGSGDSFSAGMMIGLLRGKTLADACVLGAACGAANAMTDLAGCLAVADVDDLVPRVRVEPLDPA
jgi:tagatose 6-phosphate kinase